MKRLGCVLVVLLLARLANAQQIQVLQDTDSLKTRREKENANFSLLGNKVTAFNNSAHAHSNKALLDLFPSSLGATGSFPLANGSTIVWSTDASTLINLNASALGSGTIPLARITGLTNAQIAPGAGILASKLSVSSSDVIGWLGFAPENPANKNAVNGYAGLGASGRVGLAQLPVMVGSGASHAAGRFQIRERPPAF